MASGKILGSVGCKFSGSIGRKISFTRDVLSWGGDMPACATGRLDASQMQPAFAKGLFPKPVGRKGK